MAQQARVPKFGNWESDGSVPYTQYFDNARKGRTTTGKLINPNDPDKNPEAFSEDLPPVRVSPFRTSSDPEAPKPRDGDVRGLTDSPLRHDIGARKAPSDSSHHRYGGRGNPGDPQRRAGRISGGSDHSIEQSPLHPISQAKSGIKGGVSSPSREPSRERRGSLEGHGLPPNTPERTRMRPGGRDDGIPEKGSAVPKFGEWDESNPSSADGYTHIFNNMRKEKQDGTARVPAMSNESSYPNGHKRDSNKSAGCSCFGWCKN